MTPTAAQIQPNTPPPPVSGSREKKLAAMICLFLAAITAAVFGRTLRFGFVNLDDTQYVYANPVVSQGLTWKGFLWAFGAHASNWHPLTWLSHMLDCQFYGLHAGGHHLTNVILHTATVIALFLVLRNMTGALWRSAFVAAVFAIHPLRVESVAWVAERKDVLSGLFFVLTVGAFARYTRMPKSGARYALVFVLFALGLMSKPMLVTLPVALLLLNYWPLNQPTALKRFSSLFIPMFALSAAACVATVMAQHGAIAPMKMLSFQARFTNVIVSYAVYLGEMFWPANLAVFYPHPKDGLPGSKVIFAACVLLALSILVWRQRRPRPWLAMGWLWYVVMLLPVIGILQVGGQAHADRYTYLPQIGLYIALTWQGAEWALRWKINRAGLAGFAVAVIAALAIGSIHQVAFWRTPETLWNRALDCTTNNALAHSNLASFYSDNNRYDDALAHFRLALQIAPEDPRTHIDMGSLLLDRGKTDEAMTNFMRALQVAPNDALAHQYLGQILANKGEDDAALAHFLKALQVKPQYPEAHYNLAKLYSNHGRYAEAIPHYQAALQNGSNYAQIHVELGSAFQQTGQANEAAGQFSEALAIDPNNAQAHYNLGNILLQAGKTDEAIAHYERAIQVNPAYAQAHANLGDALMEKGHNDEAVVQFHEALKINPKLAPALVNLGTILLQRGKLDAAATNFNQALAVNHNFAEAHGGLATVLQQKGKLLEAVSEFEKATQLQPNDPDNFNYLAWLLATARDPSIRNGNEAVQAALRANQLTGGRNPAVLRTLAAAFAEAGRFAEAQRAAQGAVQLLQASGQQSRAAEVAGELKNYQSNRPLHQ